MNYVCFEVVPWALAIACLAKHDQATINTMVSVIQVSALYLYFSISVPLWFEYNYLLTS